VIGYNAAVEDNNGKLHLKREFSANMLLMDRNSIRRCGISFRW